MNRHEPTFNFSYGLQKRYLEFDWHIDPIQLGSRLLAAKDASDFPRMLREIDHQEWRNFFAKEAEKLQKKIFE